MTHRKLQALRNLAERPGTEAEGILARELLKRHETTGIRDDEEAGLWAILGRHARGECSTDDFVAAMRRHYSDRDARLFRDLPTHWHCACGCKIEVGKKCRNAGGHVSIQEQIRSKFAKGDRVFYNYWAYSINCTARVTGYVKQGRENGSHPWAWIRLCFTHLKNGYRAVPIYSAAGWHLSKEPLPPEECERLIYAK